MKAGDVHTAQHELQRLSELESALGDLTRLGRFEIKAIGQDRFSPAEFILITVQDYGNLVTPTALAEIQAIVRAAYQAEIEAVTKKLAELGVDLPKAKPKPKKAA